MILNLIKCKKISIFSRRDLLKYWKIVVNINCHVKEADWIDWKQLKCDRQFQKRIHQIPPSEINNNRPHLLELRLRKSNRRIAPSLPVRIKTVSVGRNSAGARSDGKGGGRPNSSFLSLSLPFFSYFLDISNLGKGRRRRKAGWQARDRRKAIEAAELRSFVRSSCSSTCSGLRSRDFSTFIAVTPCGSFSSSPPFLPEKNYAKTQFLPQGSGVNSWLCFSGKHRHIEKWMREREKPSTRRHRVRLSGVFVRKN